MEHALKPGMHLMRRLSVAGKFASIAVLLLLPLCINLVGSYRDGSQRIEVAEKEQRALVYTQDLVRLYTELLQSRNLALEQREISSTLSSQLITEIDKHNAESGEDFRVADTWHALRADITALYKPGLAGSRFITQSLEDAGQVQRMIADVANNSNLVTDPNLDTHYLAAIVVQRIPQLLQQVSQAHQLQRNRTTSETIEAALSAQAGIIKTGARDLTVELTTAYDNATTFSLRNRLTEPAQAANTALTTYAANLASVGDTARTTTTATTHAALVNLADEATAVVDQLLTVRIAALRTDRAQPLLLIIGILLVVGYLLASLFRVTTRDVRTVLEEISTVTSGGVYQTTPLDGSDEFSQMSRAVVYARDKLTALVGALKYQATHDELTSLANRSLFTEKVDEALSKRNGKTSVVLIDLDGFKDINDSFGHDMGDRILRMVGARIHRGVPRRSVIARLGSDEFAVLIAGAPNQDPPEACMHRIQEVLAQPLDIDGRRMRILAGVGIAEADSDSDLTGVELIRNADVALNFAKDRGKGRTAIFEPGMHDHTRERAELSADLVQAVERGELRMVYQPLVDMQTGTLHGVESLVRWEHPERGTISPSTFIPLAETTGLIGAIGRWALQETCAQMALWQHEFPDGYPLAVEVNLSTDQLTDNNLVSDVLAVIEETGIDPTNLVIEITESSLVKDIDTALRKLGQLAAVGLKIALDDFGTGYSSLSYLRRLPVTVLKIDKSFVDDDDPEGKALLRSIAELGTSQGMQIIAEGVETVEQAAVVREAGIHLGQGYLWSKPVTPHEISDMIRRGGPLIPSHPGVPIQRTGDVSVSRDAS